MSATDLLFSGGLPSGADLTFGASAAPGTDVFIDLQLHANIDEAQYRAEISVAVDMAVPRGPCAWPTDRYQPGLPAGFNVQVALHAPISLPAWEEVDVVDATRLATADSVPWISARPASAAASAGWDQGIAVNASVADRWVELDKSIRPALGAGWDHAIDQSVSTADRWISLFRTRRPEPSISWSGALSLKITDTAKWSVALRRDKATWVVWHAGRVPGPGKSPIPVNPGPEPEIPCYVPPFGLAVDLLFSQKLPASLDLLFGCSKNEPSATIVIPVRSIYMLTNTTTLVREDTGIAIPATGLQISIDADSWDWTWSASVPGAARALLVGDYGSLVVLLATINGTLFRLALDRQPRQREFGSSSMSIGGRGRAMMLDAPFADVVTRYGDQTSTAQQLMAAALTDNGVTIGWDIDWRITDWPVPGGIWSHTGTAIDACLAIAGAAGGYIQAHRTEQVLSVLPRYPVSPWEWSSVTPDVVLPESAVVVESDDPVDKPRYNTVFVAGQEGGLQVHVTRAGTAGDRAAQMVTDPLITHVDAGRQRGLAILGDTGRQRPLTLSLPVFAETGIILPGKFVRYVAGGKSTIGLTRAVSVAADRPRTRQTITLETHDDL